MAKFCANCGSKMNDNDNVCGQCGTPAAVGQVSSAAAGQVTPVTSGNGSIFIKIAVGVIFAIVVLIILWFVIGFFSDSPKKTSSDRSDRKELGSYEKTLNKMINAIEDEDAEALGAMASSIIIAGIEEDDENFSWFVEERLDSFLDRIEDEVGVIDNISYEIVDEKEWSDRKLENQLEDYEDEFDDLDLDIILVIIRKLLSWK